VELARNFINTVTVEIPAIPEDYEELKKHILKMPGIGVDHLNLHQLFATENNYREFAKRGYTFLHSPTVFPAVLESEIAALKLLRHALDLNLSLPIQYCSHVYKKRFQCSAHRRRASTLTREEFEHLTEAGYIRRLSVKDLAVNVKTIVNTLRKNKARENLWSLDKSETEITLHHSLLKYVDFEKYSLTVTYFEPKIIIKTNNSRDARGFKEEFSGEREIIDQRTLSPTGIEIFKKLYIENKDSKEVFSLFLNGLTSKKDIYDIQQETQALMAFREWEQIGEGFPKIY